MASERAKRARGGGRESKATPKSKPKLVPRIKKSPVKTKREKKKETDEKDVKEEVGRDGGDRASVPAPGVQVEKAWAWHRPVGLADMIPMQNEQEIGNSDVNGGFQRGDLWPTAFSPENVETRVCTGCQKEGGIDWDDVDGLFVCHNCGQRIDIAETGEEVVLPGEEQLVSDTQYDHRGIQYGTVPVGAGDTGSWVAMNTMSTPGARRAMQHARRYDADVPIKKFVREYGDHLRLTRPVLEEAIEYASRIHRALPSRSMKLQMMALSGIYVAIRMNQLPLTLVDLAAVIPKGDVTVYSIGRSYRQCLMGLKLYVPPMDPVGMIPKLFAALLERYDRAEMACQTREKVLSDAKKLIGFISRTEKRSQHPTALAATSIYLAMEMNMLPMPKVDDAARALGVGETALKTKANNIRHAMAALGQHLVYGENIKARNAMKYARVIMKLSTLRSREATQRAAQPEERDAVKAAIARAIAEDERGAAAGDDPHGVDVDENLEDVDVDEYLRSEEEVNELARLRAANTS